MSDLTVQPYIATQQQTQTKQKRKTSNAKKGAIIGGIGCAGATVVANLAVRKDINALYDTLGFHKTEKFWATAIGIGGIAALGTLIGAGIGKIVDTIKDKKAKKTQPETQQTQIKSKRKTSNAKKGAIIAGIGCGGATGVANLAIRKDINALYDTLGFHKTEKFWAIAIDIGSKAALGTLIGAGIGKIVDTIKDKKAKKAQQETLQAEII